MNILYIANARLPTEKAHGYQICQMCQAFTDNGASLLLLHPKRRNPLERQGPVDIVDYYGLRRTIDHQSLGSLDFFQAALRSPLFQQKLDWVAHVIQASTFVLSAWRHTRAIHRAEGGNGVIYTRDLPLVRLLRAGIPKNLRERVFVEVHTLSEKEDRRRRQARALSECAGVICTTEVMKRQLIDLGVPGDRLMVAPDAVDFDTFDSDLTRDAARENVGFPKDRLMAVFVGRFHTMGMEKGIPEIIEAAKHLVKEFPTLDFLFVGGPLDRVGPYEALIADLGLPRERFVFVDRQPVRRVPYYLKASDILLMPHPRTLFYEKYVSPLKLFEYMTARRPIIASSLPAIEEILADGRNALLSPPGDVSAIAENIRRALTDKKLADDLSAQAYQDVRAYGWPARAKSILEFIDARL